MTTSDARKRNAERKAAMTPAETLARASETLRRLADEATPGPWDDVPGAWGLPQDGPDHMRVVQKPHQNASDAIARLEYEQQGGADAAFIALMDPDLARMLAGLMKAMSQAAYDDNYLDDELRAALALAEHINERTQDA